MNFSTEITALFDPISPEAPCGVDLESSAIAELERLAQGKPEQQIGNTIVPAEEPDWRLVQRKSLEVLGRSKDLRAATQLAKALLRSEGWIGFAQGLQVQERQVQDYWDGLFPLLDSDDDNDPTMRINILMNVGDASVVSLLRATPLITSRTLGRFSLRDVDVASGEGAPSDSNGSGAATMTAIEAAAMDADLEVLQRTHSAIKDCGARLTGLEAAVASHVESARVPSFARLAAMIRKADVFLTSMLARRLPAASADSVQATPVGASASNGSAAWTGGIRSREDVVKALDAIIAYYERSEPSSPIPIFMARSKRLVMMGFVDIVRELVPDALSTVDVLRGRVE